MRKSNWIIIGILVIASIVFLALWYTLGFNLVDSPLDLVLSIIWWVIIIVICLVIRYIEKKRQESLRTTFIAPGQIVYNRERGAVKIAQGQPVVPIIQNILSEMKYGFDYEEEPDTDSIRFKYIVHTSKFADDGDTWEGEVIDIARGGKTTEFSDRDELTALLA